MQGDETVAQERLDKIIASTGRWSRREVKTLVREGRVLVDGRLPAGAEEKADPETAEISVDGETLEYRRFVYLLMNKPGGVLSATGDSRQGTVLDLLVPELRRIGLFPVGRLDKDTQGLLLLTNDGAMGHALLSPRRHVDKVYEALLSAPADAADAAAFAAGLRLSDFTCLPAELEITEDPRRVFVTLHEGKFHQIKRMFLSRGKSVLFLRRIAMGPLRLEDTLKTGKYRYLSKQEIAELNRIKQKSEHFYTLPKKYPPNL